MIVADEGDGLVAQPGARLDEPPAQVDVLAGLQGLVESADVLQEAERRQMIAALGT